MALRVWLPLNGTLENKGISEITLSSGTPTYTNGKIGQCLNTGTLTFNLPANFISNISATKQYSICCWCKNLDASAGSRWVFMLGSGTGTSRGLWENNATALRHWAYGGSGHNIPTSINTIDGNWHHIVFTVNNNIINLYVDGIYQGQNTATATGELGGNNTVQLNATNYNLNDFRIYDHCLSAKEVKEISQGLVLHYKLDGSNQVFNGARNYLGNSRPYYTGYDFNDTNKLLRRNYNRNSSSGKPPFDQTYDACSDIVYENGDQFRRIIISSDRDNTITNNYQVMHPWIYSGLEKYTNDGSFWSQIQVGDKISFSCSVKSNNYFLLKSVLRIFTSSSNYAYHFFPDGITYGVDVGNLNTWYKLSSTLTVTQELYDLISNWDGMTRFMLIMQFSQAPNVSIANENIVIDFKEYMLEFSDTPHDWVPAPEDFNIDDTKVIDSSGYGNDGIITGTLSTESDSNRYEISTHYSGSSYTDTGSGTFNWFDFSQCTLSAWIKPTASVSSWSGSIGVQHNQNAGHKGFTITDYANNFRVVTVNGSYTIIDSGKPLTVGEWHYCAAVLNGTNLKMYYDGAMVKESTVSWGSAAIATDMRFATGVDFPGGDEMFTGNYSDVRMYCTALSAEDILDLYHTPANVDNLQNIHTFELKDNEDISQTLKNGIMATKEFHESNSELLNNFSSGGYAPAKNANNSCVNMGIADFSDYADLNKDLSIHIECDIEWTAFTADTGGTFKGIWWQGSQYDKTDSTWKWAGTNYVCSALQSSFAINATRALTAGTHHYDAITTVPASWFNTYSKSNIGFRCDYSDGTGRIDVTNFKITPSQYYNAKIGKDFISANNFIEK